MPTGKLSYVVRGKKAPGMSTIKYYPQIAPIYTLITSQQLIDRIANNSGVSRSVMVGAASALFNTISNFVANGHSVTIGNLFTLRPTCVSYPLTSPDEPNPLDAFRAWRIRATFGAELREYRDISYYSFDKWQTGKATTSNVIVPTPIRVDIAAWNTPVKVTFATKSGFVPFVSRVVLGNAQGYLKADIAPDGGSITLQGVTESLFSEWGAQHPEGVTIRVVSSVGDCTIPVRSTAI